MDCAAEEQLVRLQLEQLAGLDHFDIDLSERTVTIAHDTDPAAIEAALAGLDLDTVRLADVSEPAATATVDPQRERTALVLALGINAALFVGELVAGLMARSMGLIADSLDMAADASVYALSLAAVGHSVARQRNLAATSAYLQFGLAALGLAEVLRRIVVDTEPPDVSTMIAVSALALAGNITTLAILRRVRSAEAHIQASWIFTANDVKVNLLVIVAAVTVALVDHPAPDLIAGGLIFVIVANGARRILAVSRRT